LGDVTGDLGWLSPFPGRTGHARPPWAVVEAVADGSWTTPESFNFARDVVEHLAERPVGHPAVTYVGADGIIDRLTFAEVAARAARWTGLLAAHGVDAGDRVVVVVGRRPEWHAILLAALKRGAVAVPCSPELAPEELARRVHDSGATLVVADRSSHEALGALAGGPPVVAVEASADELFRLPAVAPTHEAPSDEPAFLLYSSGTTGPSRGVLHTHAYCHATAMQAEHWLGAGPEDRVWCTLDPGWAISLWNAFLGPWSRGAELVVDERPFDAAERVDLIDRLGVTILCQTPDEYRLLAGLGDVRASFARVESVVCAGDRLDLELVDAFREASGHTIRNGYGQTETTLLLGQLVGGASPPGSVGAAAPGHVVALIDHHGREVRAGHEGEIAVFGRPPSLFAGYWNDPDATRAAFRGDWYVTGDRAVRDADGWFWVTGRAEVELEVAAEHELSAMDVETALLEHEPVAEVAAIVSAGGHGRARVTAFVVLGPGRRRTNALVQRLYAALERAAPDGAVPEIQFVEELPRTADGDVHRAELRVRELELAGVPVVALEATDEPVVAAVGEPAEHDPFELGEAALIVAALELRAQERRAAAGERDQGEEDDEAPPQARAATDEAAPRVVTRLAQRGGRPRKPDTPAGNHA
jgi:acyl-coenzyme A synthetase/AMP-(fatty) acid ligase